MLRVALEPPSKKEELDGWVLAWESKASVRRSSQLGWPTGRRGE